MSITIPLPDRLELFRVGSPTAAHSVMRRPSKITVPEKAHPLARLIFTLMRRENVTYEELQHLAGVLVSTFKAWRTSAKPGLDTVEACLGALGWTLVPVPALRFLPDATVARLREIGGDLLEGEQALAAAIAAATSSGEPRGTLEEPAPFLDLGGKDVPGQRRSRRRSAAAA